MKESNSVCIGFEYSKYNKEIEIGYNEENRFHSIIKTNNKDNIRKGIIVDRDGNLLNSFPFSSFEGVNELDASDYLNAFLTAHLHKGLYNALIYIKNNKDKNV